jgi:hypothetical protein
MTNVIKFRKKPRPLRKTYHPNAPYEVEREDQDDGSITYYVTDVRPDSFRDIAYCNDDMGRNPYAKWDAEQIAKGMNLLVQYGLEQLPKVKERDDIEDMDDED